MKFDWQDLIIRFIFGGSAVVASYLVSLAVPWASFAGIFAAFPAVMAAAVILTGYKQGSEAAGEVAFGAVSGMLGCTFGVIGAIIFINFIHSWKLGLFLSTFVWFGASVICFAVMSKLKERVQVKQR